MKKLYLYGAGRIGRLFLNSISYKEIKNKYESMKFFDSDQSLEGYVEDIEIDHDLWKKSPDSVDILITSGFWCDIYDKCVLNGYRPMGIYDDKTDMIRSYEDMCFGVGAIYKNRLYISYEIEREKEINIAVEKYKETHDLFRAVKGIAIGLSNLCNYSNVHKLCPASCIKMKEILPTSIVKKILAEFADIGFDGMIYFHMYNEPLMDPRFFYFCEMVKKYMPKAKIMAYSNGYYLNQTMIEELIDVGIDVITVTGYGKSEYRRLQSLRVDVPYRIVYGNLDERLDIYKRPVHTIKNVYGSCRSFIAQTCIFSNGDIGVCCLDYEHPYGLGNVFKESVENILNSDMMIAFQDELLSCNRDRYEICQNCNWNR